MDTFIEWQRRHQLTLSVPSASQSASLLSPHFPLFCLFVLKHKSPVAQATLELAIFQYHTPKSWGYSKHSHAREIQLFQTVNLATLTLSHTLGTFNSLAHCGAFTEWYPGSSQSDHRNVRILKYHSLPRDDFVLFY